MGSRLGIIGLSVSIIGIACFPAGLYLEAIGLIAPSFAPLYLAFTLFFVIIGVCLLIYGISKKDKRELVNSAKPPIQLIPKRKIKRIIHRTETINGKTKYTEEVELDP